MNQGREELTAQLEGLQRYERETADELDRIYRVRYELSQCDKEAASA